MAPGTPFTDVDKPLHLHITPGACSSEVGTPLLSAQGNNERCAHAMLSNSSSNIAASSCLFMPAEHCWQHTSVGAALLADTMHVGNCPTARHRLAFIATP